MSAHAETQDARSGLPAVAWLSWVWVGLPFVYGLYQLVIKIPALFGG
jgi:hypothetical protein